jgi:hypothetical protein
VSTETNREVVVSECCSIRGEAPCLALIDGKLWGNRRHFWGYLKGADLTLQIYPLSWSFSCLQIRARRFDLSTSETEQICAVYNRKFRFF